MAYFWLIQNRSGSKSYEDIEGKIYHYRGTVSGADKLSESDLVVFYNSQRRSQSIFGVGRVTKIEGYLSFEGPSARRPVDQIPRNAAELIEYFSEYDLDEVPPPNETVAEYFAHVGDYYEIEPPLDAHEVEDKLSFLKDKSGISGIPQVSIYELSKHDFNIILDAAGLSDINL